MDKSFMPLRNPGHKVNFLSSLTFWWVIPIYKSANTHDLKNVRKYTPLAEDRAEHVQKIITMAWSNERSAALKEHRNPSLARVLRILFGKKLAVCGAFLAVLEFIKMAQAVSLGYLVLSYSSYQPNQSYIHSVIIVACSLISLFIQSACLVGLNHIALKIKVALSNLIYMKVRSLKNESKNEITVGHIINLLSNDINLDLFCVFFHNLWLGPLVCVVATAVMYNEIGFSALVGIFIIVILIPFQGWLTRLTKRKKLESSRVTDNRLQIMNELIRGILVIKMCTWEDVFRRVIGILRCKELNLKKHNQYIKGIHMAFMIFRTRTAIWASIICFTLTGNLLTAKSVFLVTACFNAMKRTVTDFFTYAMELTAFAEFTQSPSEVLSDNMLVDLKNVTAKWPGNKHNTLHNVNFVASSKFNVIIGSVGGGKTSLLNVILKEMTVSEGKVQVNGKISYASQEPWLFIGSIKKNICFNSDANEDRYKRILDVCALNGDLASLPSKDKTHVTDNGANLSGGQRLRLNLARCLYNEADIYIIDDPFSALDNQVASHINEKMRELLADKLCILVTNRYEFLRDTDQILMLENGHMKNVGSYESLRKTLSTYDVTPNVENTERAQSNHSAEKLEEKIAKSGRVSWNVYWSYFKAFGSVFTIIGTLLLFVCAQIMASASDYFVGYWVNTHRNSTAHLNDETQIYTYSTLILITVVVGFVSCLWFYDRSIKAAMFIHKEMLGGVLNTAVSFFHRNTSGEILNRFSKDVSVLDEFLPSAVINFLQTGLAILGIVVVTVIINPYMVFLTVAVFVILHLLRNVHLVVSNNLTRLELTSKSLVVNIVTTTLQGLTTLRAFKAENYLLGEFNASLNKNIYAKHILMMSTRMFAMWLEAICSGYTAVVIFSFLLYENEYGGNVGLAITQVTSMVSLIQWTVRQSSEVENQMTAAERAAEYAHLERESPDAAQCVRPPAKWPQWGKVEFRNVHLKYTNERHVLKDLTFTINPREKIGVIGRTGSGKSSILNALLQLTGTSGNIIIDQINVSQLNLDKLRSKISVIPQEPMLFSGTIRSNIDPYNRYADDQLNKIMSSLDLNKYFTNMDQGLDSKISEGGANISVGQKQLLCLVRSIVFANQILILDEATACMDPETDAAIQENIRKHFRDRTVIIIAHRLQNIMDCDKIMTIENGRLTEFDSPYSLLMNESSYLSSVIQTFDEKAKSELKTMAKEVS